MAISKKDLAKQHMLESNIKEMMAQKLSKDIEEHDSKIQKSAAMFKNTRITSCSRVLLKNGKSICMGFNVGATKPVDPNASKLTENISLAAEHYKQRDTLHCGMLKKPLSTYHPNAFRNRLPQPTVVMPYKNSSSIVIGDRSTINRRQYVSMSMNTFAKPKPFESSNQGIIAAQTSIGKHKSAQ